MKNVNKIIIVFVLFASIGIIYGLINDNDETIENIIDTETEFKLMVDDRLVDDIDNIVVDDKEIYLPLEFIIDEIDSDIEISEDKKYIYLDLSNKDYELENEELTNYVKEYTDKINLQTKYINDTTMIPVMTISKFLDITIEYIEDTNTVVLEKYNKDKKINGVRESYEPDENINITWEHVYHSSPDISDDKKIEGLDVISPTWFSVKEDGVVENKADLKYVKNAHEKGYKVWGLVDNSFDPKLTSKILNDEELKDKVIAQILLYSSMYDLDGINIDFENIYYDDKEALVSFVDDLTTMLKKQNSIVSIDVTVPGGSKQWSQVYDRKKLSKIVDYVALMAYDEHWGTSPVSGSVASIGWVEKGIKRSLEYIPKEKLLLGVPFYTRVWKEVTDEGGDADVSSKAVPIKNLEEILETNNAEIVWDDKVGQYFATYEGEENTVYKIWIEDSKSMELKIELANKYGLKGIASWRKGYEYNEIWEVIKTIKEEKELI